MATDNTPETFWVYQDGPSRREVETESRYSKTRESYGFVIKKGRMVQLQDLEKIPAPIVCPCCQKPVITTLKSERTGTQWFNVAFATIISVGILTYPVATTQRTFVHICPSCQSRIVQLSFAIGGSLVPRILRNYDSEDDKPAKNLYTTIHTHGSVYYQWNNNNSKIGTQASKIGTQHQSNEFRAPSA